MLRISKFLLVLVVLSTNLVAKAQNVKLSNATVGFAVPLEDKGIGVHLGLNIAKPLSSRFSLEGQVSFMNTFIQDTFVNRNVGHVNSINALIGGRLYLISEEKTKRFYINLMGGGVYINEAIYDYINNRVGAGFSAGAFMELDRWLLGVSLDSPQNLILKIGYVL